MFLLEIKTKLFKKNKFSCLLSTSKQRSTSSTLLHRIRRPVASLAPASEPPFSFFVCSFVSFLASRSAQFVSGQICVRLYRRECDLGFLQKGLKQSDSLFGKDARKFLKRKDSDAAEAGRALEELRSSLYNELKTSEGAKRQQQRFYGPVVAMSFNFIVAVGIILANKLLSSSLSHCFQCLLPQRQHLSLLSSLLELSWPSLLVSLIPASNTTALVSTRWLRSR